jgi:hypothetical protein
MIVTEPLTGTRPQPYPHRQLEQGQRTAPEFATVVRLARVLDVATDEFADVTR